jgi:TldD protein
VSTERTVDEDFATLPLSNLADAALSRARELGAGHADLRVERVRTGSVQLRDARLAGGGDDTDAGLAVRVLVDGVWGFAAATELSTASAARAAEQAVAMARVSTPLASERVELADEPVHAGAQWVSAYDIDPFSVPASERAELLATWSSRLLADGADHVDAGVSAVKEQKFYADLAGSSTLQQRVRINPGVTVVVASSEAVETMRTLAPGIGRGWEYLVGTPEQGAWGWDDELATLPELAVEKLKAPTVEAGAYDLVVDPSNLWLTIHESIGHATELDRALGYEAAYAGTSFATIDRLGSLQYGSGIMHVVADRTAANSLATIGYDDEGVQTQSWDIVRDGVLVGYQLDRAMARQNAERTGVARSNGCAFADSSSHVPIQRMANVNLQPAADGPSTEEMISAVDRGIYVVGDKSWSIDMQRYNFQFTGQRFYRIEHGRLVGMLRDVAYQATTTDFWGSMTRVGGPQTYVVGGAFNCGKGQPGQIAAVSHGCPSATFRQVRILNTTEEGRA